MSNRTYSLVLDLIVLLQAKFKAARSVRAKLVLTDKIGKLERELAALTDAGV